MKILCPRCHVGRIDRERCSRCGYRISQGEEEQERMGRLLRNSRIGLVSLLAGVWLIRLFYADVDEGTGSGQFSCARSARRQTAWPCGVCRPARCDARVRAVIA